MKLFVLLVLVSAATCQLNDASDGERDRRQAQQVYFGQQPRNVPAGAQLVTRFPSFGGSTPQTFRASPLDEDSINRNTVTPSPQRQQATPKAQTRRPVQAAVDNSRDYQHQVPVYRPQPQQNRGPPGQRGQYPPQQQLEEEELEEEEKPDRLTELLPQSKFDCAAKKTGYYADDGLGCEVFHYCQDNAKHSWICPEGFQFHQVHLICMPPSSDNICAQSSDYHFVNDYLYRPINTEEHEQKPNISLRYADRYYPENYYDEEHQPQPQRRPVQQVAAPVQQQQQQRRPIPQQTARPQYVQQQPTQRPHFSAAPTQRQSFTPQQFVRQQPNQVFHSPEEVNIPLQHRRPVAPSPPPRNNYQERDDDDDDDEEYEYEDPPYRQG